MIVPFDINIAKEISSGIRKGRIVTIGEENLPVKIFEWDHTGSHPIEGYIEDGISTTYSYRWTKNGYFFSTNVYHSKNLCLEIEDCPKIEFDIDTARLALLAGTGRIVTRQDVGVEITSLDGSDPNFPVEGTISDTGTLIRWSPEGKVDSIHPIPSYDLFIAELC